MAGVKVQERVGLAVVKSAGRNSNGGGCVEESVEHREQSVAEAQSNFGLESKERDDGEPGGGKVHEN